MSWFQKYQNRLQDIISTSKKTIGPIWYLNITQFCSALNDNLYKLFMIFLLISALGQSEANSILSAAGAIFVLPYLLFSSSAGILADRISKQKMLIFMKIAETMIMILALFAFYYKSVWGSYTLLFILSTHSALFGPSKYGIIPELVSRETVTRANGIITSFTYIAIILGTFLASFITELINREFVIAAAFCLLVALIGFFTSLKIPHTNPQGSTKKFNILFLRDIYRTLVFCASYDRLLIALIGAAYFLFVGAYTQLNIIPYAIQALDLSEVAGGYLFLSTAIGIACGSLLSGKISQGRPNLGVSCLACFGMSIFFIALLFSAHNLLAVITCLVGLGFCGGFFIVPLDSFVQISSPNEKRGQVIAAGNFLSFSGVLLAAFALFLFSEIFSLSAATGFFLIGIVTFFIFLSFLTRLSDQVLPFFTKKLIHPFYKIQTFPEDITKWGSSTVLVLEKATLKKVLLLSCVFPELRFYFVYKASKHLSWLNRIFYSIKFVPLSENIENLPEKISDSMVSCIISKDLLSLKEKTTPFSLKHFFKKDQQNLFYVDFQSPELESPFFSKREVLLSFSQKSSSEKQTN